MQYRKQLENQYLNCYEMERLPYLLGLRNKLIKRESIVFLSGFMGVLFLGIGTVFSWVLFVLIGGLILCIFAVLYFIWLRKIYKSL